MSSISRIKVLNGLGITSGRSINIAKQIFFSAFFKGGSVLANLLLVPVTIGYLNTTNYGVWLTISSLIGWFSIFDIGIGNGLRNKYAEAKANNDIQLARSYISTAYFFIGIIGSILAIVLLFVNGFIDWTVVFNTSGILNSDLTKLMYAVIGCFCLNLICQLITTIYIADQKSHAAGIIQFLIQVFSLLVIWILTKTTETSLLLFGTVVSVLPVLILLVISIISFNWNFKDIRPAFSFVKKEQGKEIFSVGINFFIIQLSCIVLYATSNMIISHLYGPEEVTPYNIAFKYFSITNIILSIIISPYWSGITDAFTKQDFSWIKNTMKYLTRFSFIAIVVIVLMFFVSDRLYYLWIGQDLHIPVLLSALMGVYFSMIIFMQPFVTFVNGTGKIKLQLIFSVATALINIPLSILFAKYFNLGISGIVLSGIVCSIPGIIYTPLQYKKIINGRAKGVWNK